MTKYRKENDGYVDFLQYEKETNFLFFTFKTWKYVWRPYYCSSFGRSMDTTGYDTYVCRYNNNLEDFVQKWKNIDDYFEYANEEQARLESNENKRKLKIKLKENTVSFFD